MVFIVGEKLKYLLKKKNLEQQKVAIELGLKPPTFNGYVTGKRKPTFERLNQFADYFHVSVDYLTGHSNMENAYLEHLTDEEKDFVNDPANHLYIEIAMDIRLKTFMDYSNNVLQKMNDIVKKKPRKDEE